jgi:vacuolar protein sorting-associated protein IST1
MMVEKKAALAKASRRDIATLIEKNKLETARIKVESIIHDDIHVELLEILELYCELLSARFGLLDTAAKEPDPGVYEAVNAIIHAALRTELKGELELYHRIRMPDLFESQNSTRSVICSCTNLVGNSRWL